MTDENSDNPKSEPGRLAPDEDRELAAIKVMLTALRNLTEEERRSVLEYVLRRFGGIPIQASNPGSVVREIEGPTTSTPAGAIKDIRTLKEEKAPRSANEMAVLVAFYVSELAPPEERKKEINKDDIERYFKTGNFKLTAKAGQTLVNAKNAGYLDAGSDSGYYKLNPVGYNLVAHRLPVKSQAGSKGR